MIKSSKHSIKFANKEKKENLSIFINEYRRVAGIYIDYIWENGYQYYDTTSDTFLIFDIKNKLYDLPKYIDNNIIKIDTFLTSRATKCAITQVRGILNSATKKYKILLYSLKKARTENRNRNYINRIKKLLLANIPQKPNHTNINPELNSICCNFKESNGYFDGFFEICSITIDKMEIRLPVNHHKHSNKFIDKNCVMRKSFLIKKDMIIIRWDIINPPKKQTGITVGCDQGKKTILTFSNELNVVEKDPAGYTLEKVIDKMVRKKKGSNAFKRCQEHRKNLTNYIINRIDFSGINQINLEKIINIGYKKRQPRKLQHWNNPEIMNKLIEVACLNGVHVNKHDSAYMSQRCSNCGMVRKANRKGKVYKCKNCGLEIDADLNAALNHELELPKIGYSLRMLRKNLKGFFWNLDGFFELTGEEFTVPLSDQNKTN